MVRSEAVNPAADFIKIACSGQICLSADELNRDSGFHRENGCCPSVGSRGAAPENTLTTFRLAALEIDVELGRRLH